MRIVLVLLLFAAAGCGHDRPIVLAPRPSEIILVVVTWNTHAGAGDLPRLVDDVSSGRLTGAPGRDFVLLLQEAVENGAHDVTRLARERALSVFFAPVRQSDPRSTGNAILATRPLLDARTIALPRERQPRAAVTASVDVDGRRLFVVCAHLENRISWLRGGLFSDSARGRQAEALLRALPPQGPGIAGGDFNTWLGVTEPAWRAFTRRFADTPRDKPEPTFRDRLVLDHLFFDLPDGWEATRRVVADRYGSDHHPVLGLVTRVRR